MSSTTRLPANGDSSWDTPLNDFLNQALIGSTTASVNNGLLREDHAAITKGGKVGVGTTTPTNKLHITDTTNPVKIEGLAAGAVADDVVTISTTGVVTKTAKSAFVTPAQGTFNNVGGTSPSTVVTDDIYHSGRVGIGTVNPLGDLDVKNSLIVGFGANGSTYVRPTSPIGDVFINDTGFYTRINTNSNTGPVIVGNGNPLPGLDAFFVRAGGTNIESGSLGIASAFPALTFAQLGVNSTHIGSMPSGNLGFYTTSPNSKLNSSVEVPNMVISPLGIGIGNSTPAFPLSVGDGSNANSIAFFNRPATTPNLDVYTSFDGTVNNFGGYGIQPSSKSFKILSANAGIALISFAVNTITGNVGIGTENPTSRLEVVGLPVFADNAAALAGLLNVGAFYRTATGNLNVVF